MRSTALAKARLTLHDFVTGQHTTTDWNIFGGIHENHGHAYRDNFHLFVSHDADIQRYAVGKYWEKKLLELITFDWKPQRQGRDLEYKKTVKWQTGNSTSNANFKTNFIIIPYHLLHYSKTAQHYNNCYTL